MDVLSHKNGFYSCASIVSTAARDFNHLRLSSEPVVAVPRLIKSATSARRFNRASLETMAEHNRVTLQGAIADQIAMQRAETARLIAASKALVQRSRLIKQQSEEALAKTAAIRKAFMAIQTAKRIATGEDHAQREAD